ncbi:MAG: capsular polysaccharide biosynthesis protein, partial [Pseudomonadota bacterium]
LVVEQPLSLADALHTVDRVYTATSLGGFEALLRGIAVTTIGRPFYAGWGLTDDRQVFEPKRPCRSLAELFAASYLLYPRYRHPETGAVITFEQAVDYLASQRP